MGLRSGGEKPAPVLPLVYTLGWLPALIAAALARRAAGPTHVLAGAGEAGLRAGLGLALSLVVLGTGYLAAIRWPPAQRTLLAACIGSLSAALAMPVLFSADVYAYAYYGDLALHGRDPYAHDPAALHDALSAAAVAAWDGHIPPRCVYGPLAVGIAALADLAGAAAGVAGAPAGVAGAAAGVAGAPADVAGAAAGLAGAPAGVAGATAAGVAGQITAQRLVAAAAYALYVWAALRLTRVARTRAALVLNPVVLWSVAEGHNDAAMLGLVMAGFTVVRARALLFASAALVKAPALLVLGTLGRRRTSMVTAAFIIAGYMPLAIAFAAGAQDAPAASHAAWQSPLGLLASLVGRLSAVALALTALGIMALAVRRWPPAERTAALAFAAWFALPNAYPWYALWIVPLAARKLTSVWSRTLLVASLFAAVRAVVDVILPMANTFDAADTFQGRMIALEFLPPLCFLALAGLRRRAQVISAAIVVTLACCPFSVGAQTAGPSPLASGQTAPAPQPQPAPPLPAPASPPPAGTTAPAAPPQGPPVSPGPPTAGPGAAPTPTPVLAPSPAISAPAATLPAPAPAPAPTPNPFTYIITPLPIPATTPDGPHIIQVDLNDRRIRAGGPLVVRVFTSANVVGVEARALGRFIPIPQNSPGLFSLAYTMPGMIPFWLLNKNYNIVIAAATADGRQTSVAFPMLLTR